MSRKPNRLNTLSMLSFSVRTSARTSSRPLSRAIPYEHLQDLVPRRLPWNLSCTRTAFAGLQVRVHNKSCNPIMLFFPSSSISALSPCAGRNRYYRKGVSHSWDIFFDNGKESRPQCFFRQGGEHLMLRGLVFRGVWPSEHSVPSDSCQGVVTLGYRSNNQVRVRRSTTSVI